MILCLVRRPLDCGGVSHAIQIGNLQFTITITIYTVELFDFSVQPNVAERHTKSRELLVERNVDDCRYNRAVGKSIQSFSVAFHKPIDLIHFRKIENDCDVEKCVSY